MEINEALDQIGFLQQIAHRSRVRFADGYRHLLLWGVIWIIGYGSRPSLPEVGRHWLWPVLTIIGAIASTIIGKTDRNGEPTPVLLRQVGQASGVLLVSAILVLAMFCRTDPAVTKAYFPFVAGTIYAMSGVFIGSEAVATGVWLIAVALFSMWLPSPVQDYFLAIAGGGALVVSGLLMRRLVTPQVVTPS